MTTAPSTSSGSSPGNLPSSLFGGLDLAVEQQLLPDKQHLLGVFQPQLASLRNQSYTASYQQTLWTRLFLLGYLNQPTAKPQTGETASANLLQKAVKAFQRDAGIVEDGWAGDITWGLLEQLVSFEADQDPACWHPALLQLRQDGRWINAALSRALRLRLFALGLLPQRPGKLPSGMQGNHDLRQLPNTVLALRQGRQFLQALGIPIPEPDWNDSASLHLWLIRFFLKPLFGQDDITRRLSQQDDRFFSHQNPTGDFTRPISAVAVIELWLNGLDIQPGEHPFEPQAPAGRTSKPIGHGKQRLRSAANQVNLDVRQRLQSAIQQFRNLTDSCNNKISRAATQQQSSKIDQSLFIAFQQASEQASKQGAGKPPLAESLQQQLQQQLQQHPSLLQTLGDTIKATASRIWDGIKRATGWLWRSLGNSGKQLLQHLKNAARYIANRAREAFRYVAATMRIIQRSVDYWLLTGPQQAGPQSTAGVVWYFQSSDFDQCQLLDGNASVAQHKRAIAKAGQWSGLYQASCRIIAALAQITRQLLTNWLTANWLLGMFALTRLAEQAATIRHQVLAIEGLLAADESDLYQQIFG
ncbi:peptidoglycan-binding domain-containing protein [Oceanobacter mangrovi]|uniref:peptidoglycan-binding domain-containing protein n=1 Tax=Oceanobacter mangrovi TaxID=2862510 RepID=UPI001C8D07E0|nr:peptidoglycan-binding domain-containing protein [Oceanobacter mangrovi]